MNDSIFLDTNLFIYQLEFLDERKAGISENIIFQGISNGNSCISFQVIQECLNIIRRKAEITLDDSGTRRYLEAVLCPLWKVMPSYELYAHCLDLQRRYKYGFYDSLIIAAALKAGCSFLYSEDLQHNQIIGNLRIQNPFL
jgi:predicted nucleic acid-binding protein